MTDYKVKKRFIDKDEHVVREAGDEIKLSAKRAEEILANVNGPYIEEIKEEIEEEEKQAETSEETKEAKTPKKSK